MDSLYQDVPLEQAYYISETAQGDAITKTNRRYVLGRSLKPSPSFMTFTSAQAGLVGDLDIRSQSPSTAFPNPALALDTSTEAPRSKRSSSR